LRRENKGGSLRDVFRSARAQWMALLNPGDLFRRQKCERLLCHCRANKTWRNRIDAYAEEMKSMLPPFSSMTSRRQMARASSIPAKRFTSNIGLYESTVFELSPRVVTIPAA
jgi:hypothetical protein